MWSDFYVLSNLVQALVASVLAAALVALYRIYRRTHLRLWAAAWGASAVSLLAGAASVHFVPVHSTPTATLRTLWMVVGAGQAVQAAALVLGALAYASLIPQRRDRRLALVFSLLAGAVLGLGQPDTVLGQLRAGLLPTMSGAAFIWSAVLLWRWRSSGLSGLVAPPVLACYGALKLAYPTLLLAASSADDDSGGGRFISALITGDSLVQTLVNVALLFWLLLEERGKVESASGELRRATQVDHLTGLPNREAFVAALTAAVPRAREEQRTLAVLLIDLDGFKPINESLGQRLGDLLLQEVARRLQAAAPARSRLARLGGDEFALLLPDPGLPADVDEVAAELLEAVRPPLRLDGRDLTMTASAGIALLPPEASGPEELLGAATLANSVAAAAGGDRAQLYLPSLGDAARGRLSAVLALRHAVEAGEFVLHFQPVVSLASGCVQAVEALVRWQRPGGPLLLPGAFLPLCDAAGIADRLDDFVLHSACEHARELRRTAPGLRVAVNLSARFFHSGAPVERVNAALAASGLPASALELEITESAAMRDADGTLSVLRALKGLGLRLAIDDFGTGYSSLSYLRRFPMDTLKIDQSFIRGLGEGEGGSTLVEVILGLGHSLRMEVVAEGVETAGQLEWLKAHRCDLVQGFLLARPLGREECAAAITALNGNGSGG